MEMVSPQEWGARVNYDTWQDTPYTKDDVAIHYLGPSPSGWKDGPEREMQILRGAEAYHLDSRGWRGLAYGYAIGASGTIYRARGKNNYGAHQGDWDGDGISNNKEVVPILFLLGAGDEPNAEMWLACRALYQWLLVQPWTDGYLKVKGHKEIQPKATACPGSLIMSGIKAGWVQIPPPVEPEPEPELWAGPGDPIRDDQDAAAVLAYLGLLGKSPIEREAWALDALMRHDKRMTEGGI